MEQNINHSIGKTITELRKKKNWTQKKLAEIIQVSDKTISKWEKDIGAPSIEFFPILSKVFGVSIDSLMIGKQEQTDMNILPNANSINSNKIITESLEYGIINMDKLLNSSDLTAISNTLSLYPISITEKLARLFIDKNFRAIYQWAIDNNDNALASKCLNYSNLISNDSANEIIDHIALLEQHKPTRKRHSHNSTETRYNYSYNYQCGDSNTKANNIISFFEKIKEKALRKN